MKALTLFGCMAFVASAGMPAPAQFEHARGLTVHEWGTFLTMNGSDGVSLDGMYHEEHALPGFVHSRAKDQLKLHSAITKGETPVIYFYTDQSVKVNVRVDFPGGVWTQWYPEARRVGPGIASGGSPPPSKNGHIEWSALVQPPQEGRNPILPATSADALWNYARQVDAAFVRCANETAETSAAEFERFLFYRGLGTVDMPLGAGIQSNGTISLSASMNDPVRHLLVLRVENGRGAFKTVDELKPGASLTNVFPSMDSAQPLPEFTRSVADILAARLTRSGLFEKEARAMVNTWKSSYFGTDGIRVLYILPRSWTDQFIPMKIEPRPDRVVRVMVGRTELLTPERENRAQAAVRGLSSPDTVVREKAFAFLRDQGRYVEPILKQIQRSTTNSNLRSMCSRLLLTDFVTELRTATRAASDGSPVTEKPVFVRAQLASLLRDAGLNEEARDEGRRVLAELEQVSRPEDTSSGARHHLRAYARAAEAIGDDKLAVDWYARFVKFGSQSKTCGGCHHEEGPRTMAFYREWWAGKRYAAAVKRQGETEKSIRTLRDRLAANTTDTASQMMLAYLLQEMGEPKRAADLWAAVEGKTVRTVKAVPARASGISTGRDKRPLSNARAETQPPGS